jgi:hypothetical protein
MIKPILTLTGGGKVCFGYPLTDIRMVGGIFRNGGHNIKLCNMSIYTPVSYHTVVYVHVYVWGGDNHIYKWLPPSPFLLTLRFTGRENQFLI